MLNLHPSTTPTQTVARRFLIGVCVLLTIGVTAAAIAQARHQSDRAAVVFAPAPAQATVPVVAAGVSNEGMELIHDAAPLASSPVTLSAPAESSHTIKMIVTAYCPCAKCCGASAHGVTASGKPVTYHDGRFVAADTHKLPFGTHLVIPGYNDGKSVEVIDTGSAIAGNRLDVFFPTHQQALAWGRQTVNVKVVDGPAR
jgi:3D (Asp-Asp-Asp) domain-containing protein